MLVRIQPPLPKMRKFKKIFLYGYGTGRELFYKCKRCGDISEACPNCVSPLYILSFDPYMWICKKCKSKFTILDLRFPKNPCKN